MDRLTAEDRIMLLGDDVWPQDIGALAILDGGPLLDTDGQPRVEVVRQAVAGRLHLLPRFRQLLYRPAPGLGGPLWVDAPALDLDDHVRVAPVPPPGDERQLLHTVEGLRRRRLDPTRPLWEIWLLPGLPGQRVGLYVRMHHAIADGMAGVATLATLLATGPDTPPEPSHPWEPTPAPSTRDLLGEHVRRQVSRLRTAVASLARLRGTLRGLAAAWPTVRWLLTAKPGPATSLDRVVGPDRSLAVVRVDLDPVISFAHRYGATVNDVLLTVVTAGLRALLHHRGERTQDLTLPIYVPFSLHTERPDQRTGNLVSQMVVPLPVGAADVEDRIRTIAGETARRKAQAHPSVGALFPPWIPSRMIMRFAGSRRVNLTSTNLPGPTTPLHVAGAPLLEVFPVLPLVGNVTLGVGAMSYAGRFALMVVADLDTVPDLEVFVRGVEEELETVRSTARVPQPSRR